MRLKRRDFINLSALAAGTGIITGFRSSPSNENNFLGDLKNMTDEPVDLTVEGIWDATRAVTQTIENATSAAGSLITVGALVTPIDEE